MKKYRFQILAMAVLCLQLLCASFAVCTKAADTDNGLQVTAGIAAVADLDSGVILYEKNSAETFEPGNLAKLMTALLITETYDLNSTVSFSEIIYQTEEGSPELGLQPGEEISLYDAVCALLLGNADDVANGVAEYAAGSREAFAERMNARARELGCVNTHFTDPNGYSDENQYTCAADVIRICRAAYEKEAFREICGKTAYVVPATNLTEETRQLQNAQLMLSQDSGVWQEYCVGGFESTSAQGTEDSTVFCSSGGRTLAVLAVGAASARDAAEDAALLAEYGFAHAAEAEAQAETEETASDKTDQEIFETQGDLAGQDVLETQNVEENPDGWLEKLKKKGEEALDFVSHHKELATAAAVCALSGLLFLVLALSTIRRIRNAKIRKKRNKARKICREKERQIDQMSMEDLENELRRRKQESGDGENSRKGNV